MTNEAASADHSRTTAVERRPVPGYEGVYDVDTLGRVHSLARDIPRLRNGSRFVTTVQERILKPTIDRYGYQAVTLHRDGTPWRVGVHRLVCLTFHGEPPLADMHAAHKDGVKTNNHPSNLKWATAAENNEDRRAHGAHPMGEALPHTKLNAAKVREVVRRCRSGESQSAVARDMGVSNVAISKVMLGKSWRQVTGFEPHPDILAEIARLTPQDKE